MFEWDVAKSAKNLRERGFDFVYAAKVFEQPTIEADDKRARYGEQRVRAIGQVDDQVLFVVYTWRGVVRRIISARKSTIVSKRSAWLLFDTIVLSIQRLRP